jgi:hypothetical protein
VRYRQNLLQIFHENELNETPIIDRDSRELCTINNRIHSVQHFVLHLREEILPNKIEARLL